MTALLHQRGATIQMGAVGVSLCQPGWYFNVISNDVPDQYQYWLKLSVRLIIKIINFSMVYGQPSFNVMYEHSILHTLSDQTTSFKLLFDASKKRK